MSILHKIWRVLKPLIEVIVAVVVVLVLIAVPTLNQSAGSIKNNLSGFVVQAVTTTGPLTGDQSVIQTEISCIKNYAANPANNYVGYLPAIGAPEHTDNVRSGVYPCATFTGSFTGPNQVYQFNSQTTYDQIGLVVFDGPNAGYLQAGGLGPPSSGQYVSKFDPSTGQEIWRTYLTNINVSGQWIAFGSMAVINDGTIINAAGHTFWKLDPKSGAILAVQQQPILGMPAKDVNFDGMMVAPDKAGTLLIKTQTRPVGCPTQGNGAMQSCQAQYGPQPDTNVVAVDPTTLKNLDVIQLDQSVTARGIATEHNGQIYLYMNGAKSLVRVIWNPQTQKLTQDKSWEPVVLTPGLTGGASPVLMGNWVIADSNGNGSKTTPQCLFVVNQDNPNNVHSICPWGTTMPAGATVSDTLAAPGVDADNSLIFADDYGLKGVYAIHLDQQTGDLKVAWSRPDWWTSDYFSMVGPPNQRVLISQYINPATTNADIVTGFDYTESVLWANEATGQTIAQSKYNASTALGSLANIGYGGRVYMMGNAGTLFIYQVEPQTSSSSGTPTPAPSPLTPTPTPSSSG
jgi:hypothetical protein